MKQICIYRIVKNEKCIFRYMSGKQLRRNVNPELCMIQNV